jgi:enterochelin esterase-like enzyme
MTLRKKTIPLSNQPGIIILVFMVSAFLLTGCLPAVRQIPAAHYLQSPCLPDPLPYTVHTPPEWDGVTPLPLAILLHDRHETGSVFEDSHVVSHLHGLMATGHIPAVLLAVPENSEGFWWNYYDGTHRYADCLAVDFIAELNRTYPLLNEPSARHIFGVGLGAMGAVETVAMHPGVFGSAGALNGRYFDAAGAADYVRGRPFSGFNAVFGPPESQKAMTARSIYDRITSAADVAHTRFVLGHTLRSGWEIADSNEFFLRHLATLGIPHDFVVFHGSSLKSEERAMVAICIAVQLGLNDLYGEIDGVPYQVLKYR